MNGRLLNNCVKKIVHCSHVAGQTCVLSYLLDPVIRSRGIENTVPIGIDLGEPSEKYTHNQKTIL